MVLFMLPAMFIILGASPFLHLARALSRSQETVTLARKSTYDRTMQLFGGMWFMLLASASPTIGSSPSTPGFAVVEHLPRQLLPAACISDHDPAAGKGARGGLAAKSGVRRHLHAMDHRFLRRDRPGFAASASTAFMLTGMIMMLVTIRHLGGSFSLVPRPLCGATSVPMDQAPALFGRGGRHRRRGA